MHSSMHYEITTKTHSTFLSLAGVNPYVQLECYEEEFKVGVGAHAFI